MVIHFSWLPPEINSGRIYSGAGSGPLYGAATAWQRLAQDLQASASSFDSVVTGLVNGSWSGPASVAMAAAATPFVAWLSAAAEQAQLASGQVQAAAAAFEAALSATVHPAAVTANRASFMSLVATNFLGQNTPAIATFESSYAEMWAQDVAAMITYHANSVSIAASLTPFSAPPAQLTGLAAQAGAAVAPPWFPTDILTVFAPLAGLFSVVDDVPVSSMLSMAQFALYPASMMMSPLMMALQGARGATTGLGGAAAGLTGTGIAMGGPQFASSSLAGAGSGGLAGGGLAGGAMSARLGQANLVGPMSVPQSWQGSLPAGLTSSGVSGLGSSATPVGQAMAAAEGMPMIPPPMPMGSSAASAAPLAAVGARGGAGTAPSAVAQPSVIPRVGVG